MTATVPQLVAFDLDDTLAVSKSPIDPVIADLLVGLAEHVEVAIISGARLQQMTAQVVDRLPPHPSPHRERLHLLPTCGAQYYRLDDAGLVPVYERSLPAADIAHVMRVVETEARRLGYWHPGPWGDLLEDRGAQVTFSALGQQAPADAKAAWDPSGRKRAALAAAVSVHVPQLEVRSGGTTSIDITERGIDKAFGMRELSARTGIALDDMLFFGDRLDEGGNDYPVRAIGVPSRQVHGWPHTAELLRELLPSVRHASSAVSAAE